MGIISGFKNLAKSSLGYEQLKRQTQTLTSLAADMIKPEKASRKETFEEALKRLNLSETDIENKKYLFQKLSLLFGLISIALFIYLIYAIFQKALLASLGTFGILLMILGQWFRYHFWLFQIRQRKLGCSFKEWFYDLIGKNV